MINFFLVSFMFLKIYLQVMQSRSICFMSMNNLESFSSKVGQDNCSFNCVLNSVFASSKCMGIQFEDLYEYFEVKLNDFEVRL